MDYAAACIHGYLHCILFKSSLTSDKEGMLSDRFNWYKEIENREKQNNWTLDIPENLITVLFCYGG
jgi:hypothetical protein